MANLVERTLYRLGERLPSRVSTPSEDGYAAATAIWSKLVGRMLRAVVHCGTTDEASPAICAARDCGLPLSASAGGHNRTRKPPLNVRKEFPNERDRKAGGFLPRLSARRSKSGPLDSASFDDARAVSARLPRRRRGQGRPRRGRQSRCLWSVHPHN
jgi:hypothetical protein